MLAGSLNVWLAIVFLAWVPTSHAQAGQSEDPGFATCAAYFFLAARGHGVKDYDRLYTSGEHSFNLAVDRHGKEAATAKLGAASNTMMDAMRQDWREIAILDNEYASPCDALLRDTGFRYD